MELPAMLDIVLYVLAAALAIIGVLGVVLPALPGLPLVFAGMLLAAYVGGFERVGPVTLVILGVITVFSIAIDFIATAMGAKRVGASRSAIVGAMVGTVAGLFFGLVGVFVLPFVGAVAGELLHRRALAGDDFGHATKVGLGTWLGIVFGMVTKLALACAMIGVFAIAWFF